MHQDLKPANVLMAEDGPRVIDFGISRACDNQALARTGRVIGTPPFMSPEQLRSPRDVTAASDVFSLGSLLVYAACGNSPFEAESPYMAGYQVMYEEPEMDSVPEPLRAITARCLAKDPAARPDLIELHHLLDLSAPAVSAARDEVYFANRFGRLLGLDAATGAELWRTGPLDDPGDIAAEAPPSVLLVGDAIVAMAGDTAFSVRPDEPEARSSPAGARPAGD
ncbi:hypothetical protein GCM10017771_30100 [Streptomyces capitiformicae]|uniref:non-specific serine/threonine protein kinase n=1 Tax=Streptomyces capitiformicae TaxID=2014920 RepID=A0A919GMV1_9ACTN|nr:hypothetical protein GCM10017771_30100 [Streptomyces capitiformicae]